MFLVLSIPDPAVIPAMRNYSDAVKKELNLLATHINSLVTKGIEDIKAKTPDVKFALVDSMALIQKILKSGKFIDGIFNPHDPNIAPGDIFKYAWYNHFHPSTMIHAEFAQATVSALKKNGFV